MTRTVSAPDPIAESSSDNTTEVPRKVSDQEIAVKAYELYQARGGGDGMDLEDWLQAERELSETDGD